MVPRCAPSTRSVSAMPRASIQIPHTPIATWQAYLRWNLIGTAAPYLSKQFVEADFDFGGRTLRGVADQHDRHAGGIFHRGDRRRWRCADLHQDAGRARHGDTRHR